MELTPTNITALVKSYGHGSLIGTPQQLLDCPALCHYDFTTKQFAKWYADALKPQSSVPLLLPSFHDINLALSKHPKCKQVCSNTDLDSSWGWRLPL